MDDAPLLFPRAPGKGFTVRTVAKALTILDLFTEETPSLRLADIAERTGLDRSTAYRMLQTLCEFGYLDQSEETKKYRLGATVVRLARTRDAVVQTGDLYHDLLRRLTQETQETSHASHLAGYQIATIAACPGLHNNRVFVEAGGRLEPHATASGIACLAYAGPAFLERALARPLTSFAENTPMTPEDLMAALTATRKRGYSTAPGTFDPEVYGVAAPIFGAKGLAVGAVAVATPFSRMTPELERHIARCTIAAGLEASRVEAGVVPESYLELTRTILE